MTELLKEDREERIAELEHRIARTSGVGVKAPVALAAIVLSVALLYYERVDLAYFLSPREPISLGTEGDYRFEELRSNRYSQIHGTPTTRGAYSHERGATFVIVGLRDTPLLVHRPAFPGEAPPAQPNQTPFAVRGRVLERADAEKYEEGFAKLEEMGEVRPRDGKLWILLEGERPGRDTLSALLAAALIAFTLLNGWFLWRDLAHRARARREAQSPKA